MAEQSEGPEQAVAASSADLASLSVTQSWAKNKTALKWIRDSHEDPPGFPTTNSVDLTCTDPMRIGVIGKSSGMDYSFKPGETTEWSWRQMLAALPPAAKERVLGSNHALGVIRLTCEPSCGYKDQNRLHASLHIGRPYADGATIPRWEFVITRSDGTAVRLHLCYTSNRVEVAKVLENQAARELPKPTSKGNGKSDGRGTCGRKTQGNYARVAPAPHINRGAGDGSAVAEQRRGGDALFRSVTLAAPPGLEISVLHRRRERPKGRTDNSWHNPRRQDWSYGWQTRVRGWHASDSGWQNQGNDWQGRGHGPFNDARSFQ